MVDHLHDYEERKATWESPYHFVDSGLPNVYLVGIKYGVCKACKKQAADIPALKSLMQVIARAVVEKEAQLTGPEIRFLRKRVGKKSLEFAHIIGVTAEQVSRWENGHNPPESSADKLIRIFYSFLSGDPKLKNRIDEDIESWLETISRESHPSEIRAKLRNHEWRAEPVLA